MEMVHWKRSPLADRLLLAVFSFFLVKGLLWLLVPTLIALFR
jgi:hypothetical protein